MENKMYTKPQYKCAICGTIYDDLRERVNCESSCLKKQEEEAKKAAELKKKEEQAARKAEVDELVKKTVEAIKKYGDDYGCYELELDEPVEIDEEELNCDFPWPSRVLHYFL